MLRVIAHKSAVAARRYYTEGLAREDYYSEGQEIVGRWLGKGAELLNLRGDVAAEEFAALIDNRHPGTGKRLTARQNADRVVGYDLNFHAPKSLSVLYAINRDKAIVEAFRAAVAETMQEMEAKAATRIRKGRQQENRVTGNLTWAEFVHFTSRPVGGIPDPHLHVHCFAGNATWDDAEKRWKAANFRAIKEDAPFSEALFHTKLASKIAALGYAVERSPRGWEVAGINRSIIEKFSRRKAEIEALAKAKGISDPKEKDMLGASSRAGKRHGLTFEDLQQEWKKRLTPEELARIVQSGRRDPQRSRKVVTAREVVDEACSKLFAKSSVVELRKLAAEAMRYGVGQVFEAEALAELQRRELVRRTVQGKTFCTSLEALAEEVALIQFVRTGRAMHDRLGGRKPTIEGNQLSAEQKQAALHILESQDQVVALRGAAGVGKTTLMKEVVACLKGRGREVYVFAPSASASRGTLRDEGFSNAETVAHLLNNPDLQRAVKGKVIWVDEVGLLGVGDLWRLMKICGSDTRVILTGDIAQHGPVSRGDALRILQKYSGLKVAEVKKIRRQKREDYRKAISALSKGDIRTGFRRLEALGAVCEIEDENERYRQLATDFLDLSSAKNIPLAVSPTHAEGELVTAAIRNAKKEKGLLGPECDYLQYHDLKWEEADRRHAPNYRLGMMIQFHQNAKSIGRGQIFHVTECKPDGEVLIRSEAGVVQALPLKDASRFQVYEERALKLARGDRIRITRNGKSVDGRRLSNGGSYQIEKIGENGNFILNTGAILSYRHGHLAHGYCHTSHASQGKTVKDVLVAQSSKSFLASSRQQFYVSVSRAQESVRIYTDDRQGLNEAIGATSERQSAIEFANVTPNDIDRMDPKLTGKQWRDLVRSQRADEGTQDSLRRFLKSRRGDDAKATSVMRKTLSLRRRHAEATAAEPVERKEKVVARPPEKAETKNQGAVPPVPAKEAKPVQTALKPSVGEVGKEPTAKPALGLLPKQVDLSPAKPVESKSGIGAPNPPPKVEAKLSALPKSEPANEVAAKPVPPQRANRAQAVATSAKAYFAEIRARVQTASVGMKKGADIKKATPNPAGDAAHHKKQVAADKAVAAPQKPPVKAPVAAPVARSTK